MPKTPAPVAPNSLMKHIAVPLTSRERQEKQDELVRTLNDLERLLERLHEHFAMLKHNTRPR